MDRKRLPLYLLTGIFLMFVAVGRTNLAFIRYFDPDELAHLHWTYLISQGFLPYRDIFMYHIPFFQWLLAPIFINSPTANSVLTIRIIMLVIFGINLVLMFFITSKLIESVETAILAVSLYSVFPMILDKTVDVRPDSLMVLFFLLSCLILLSPSIPGKLRMALSGLSFGFSLMVFPKIIYGLAALLYLIFSDKKKGQTQTASELLFFFIFLSLPFIFLIVYLLSHKLLDRAIVSFFHFSLAVTGGKIPFPPWYSLLPWPVVYMAQKGPSYPWVLNLVCWVLSVPGFFSLWKGSKRLFCFSVLFLAGGIALLFIFPTPYIQYFLPLTVFISILSAIVIQKTITFIRLGPVGYLVIFALAGFSFFQQYKVRITNNNNEQLGVIRDTLRISKADETFYDATGSYVFRPDGYIFCCHPYWEFAHLLKTKYPSVRESLISNRTKFLVMDRRGYIFWKILEPDLSFLKKNYLTSAYKKIYTLGQQFSCHDGKCTQLDVNNAPTQLMSSIETVIPETYRMHSDPPGEKVLIDGKEVKDTIILSEGIHRFTVSPTLKYFKLQLDR